MKSILFLAPAILIIACGTNGSEEPSDTLEAVDEEILTVSEQETDTLITVETTDPMYTLQNRGIGLFTIGITREEVEEIAFEYGNVEVAGIEISQEGTTEPALELTFNSTDKIIFELSSYDATIFRARINSSLFKTEEGIGIGSTYGDLALNYSFDGIAWGDGGNPLVIVIETGMSFVLDPGDWWQNGEFQGEVPDDSEITGIFLW